MLAYIGKKPYLCIRNKKKEQPKHTNAMRKEEFAKLVQAMKLIKKYANKETELCQAAQLLREIFTAEGGIDRFLDEM